MPDHKDPQDFAWALHTSNNYQEASEKLNCSVGTISVWKKKHGDKLEEYDESDFTEKKPNPDEVDTGHIEQLIRNALSIELEKSGTTLTGKKFGFVVDIEGNISEVSGKDINPFIAISEHELTDIIEDKCQDVNVGLIVVSENDIEVPIDSEVTKGSGMRALLIDEAATHEKYLSVAWLEQALDDGYSRVDIARECSIQPRSVDVTLEEFGLNPS